MRLPQNIGRLDRALRLSLAALVVLLFLAGRLRGMLALVLGIFASNWIVTSLTGFCPVYWPLRFSTRPADE